jgi:hypothetical protein
MRRKSLRVNGKDSSEIDRYEQIREHDSKSGCEMEVWGKEKTALKASNF